MEEAGVAYRLWLPLVPALWLRDEDREGRRARRRRLERGPRVLRPAAAAAGTVHAVALLLALADRAATPTRAFPVAAPVETTTRTFPVAAPVETTTPERAAKKHLAGRVARRVRVLAAVRDVPRARVVAGAGAARAAAAAAPGRTGGAAPNEPVRRAEPAPAKPARRTAPERSPHHAAGRQHPRAGRAGRTARPGRAPARRRRRRDARAAVPRTQLPGRRIGRHPAVPDRHRGCRLPAQATRHGHLHELRRNRTTDPGAGEDNPDADSLSRTARLHRPSNGKHRNRNPC